MWVHMDWEQRIVIVLIFISLLGTTIGIVFQIAPIQTFSLLLLIMAMIILFEPLCTFDLEAVKEVRSGTLYRWKRIEGEDGPIDMEYSEEDARRRQYHVEKWSLVITFVLVFISFLMTPLLNESIGIYALTLFSLWFLFGGFTHYRSLIIPSKFTGTLQKYSTFILSIVITVFLSTMYTITTPHLPVYEYLEFSGTSALVIIPPWCIGAVLKWILLRRWNSPHGAE